MSLNNLKKYFSPIPPKNPNNHTNAMNSVSKTAHNKMHQFSMQQSKANGISQYKPQSVSTTPGYPNGYVTSTATTSSTPGSYANVPNMSTSSSTDSWDAMQGKLSKKEKKVLVNAGFKYNKSTEKWKLKMSVEIEMKAPMEVFSFTGADFDLPTASVEGALNAIKELKKRLIDKLTARAVLLELTKPHKIKE